VIKVSDLLTEDEVLEENRAAITSPETFLVPDVSTDIRGEVPLGVVYFIFRQVVSGDTLRSGSEAADVSKRALRLRNSSSP
jgi:hypothetical protein